MKPHFTMSTGPNDILAGLFRRILALKAVEEAARVVALLVALPVLEKIPARDTGGAVGPRLLPVERAVATIPLAVVVVALVIADLIPQEPLALHIRAGASSRQVVLTVAPREV